MTTNMADLISKAEQMARNNDDEAAMLLANELVARYPDELKVWSLRAYMHGRNRNYSKAVSDFTLPLESMLKNRSWA